MQKKHVKHTRESRSGSYVETPITIPSAPIQPAASPPSSIDGDSVDDAVTNSPSLPGSTESSDFDESSERDPDEVAEVLLNLDGRGDVQDSSDSEASDSIAYQRDNDVSAGSEQAAHERAQDAAALGNQDEVDALDEVLKAELETFEAVGNLISEAFSAGNIALTLSTAASSAVDAAAIALRESTTNIDQAIALGLPTTPSNLSNSFLSATAADARSRTVVAQNALNDAVYAICQNKVAIGAALIKDFPSASANRRRPADDGNDNIAGPSGLRTDAPKRARISDSA